MRRCKRPMITSVLAGVALAAPAALVGASPAAAQSGTGVGTPDGLQVTDLGSNHVALAWDPAAEADRYDVQLQRAPSGKSWRWGTTEETAATVFLDSDTRAQVRVRAYAGGSGWSEWTEPVEFRTPRERGGSEPVPTDLEVVEEDPVSVTLGWQPPFEPSDGLTYYRVQVWRSGETCCLEFDTVEEPSGTFTLEPGTTYLARVAARDTMGSYSDHSEEFEFTTPDEAPVSTPEDLRLDTSDGRVAASWAPSSSPIGVNGYEVTLEHEGATETTFTADTAAEFPVPEGGDITVRVRAEDTAERWSDPATAEATVPPLEAWNEMGPPRNVELNFDDRGVVEDLVWDPPAGGDGSFRYDVHMGFGGSDDKFFLLSVDEPRADIRSQVGSMVECPDSVRPGDQFFLSVTAHTQGRESPRSEEAVMCS